MLQRLLIALALLVLPASALAQDIEGSWDLRIDGTTIFRFDIAEGEDGEWLGTWHRPDRFRSDGNAFGGLSGPVEEVPSMAGYEFAGLVELSFDDPRPDAIPDIFRFRLIADEVVEMNYVGTDLAPYMLVRAGDGDPIGNWDADRVFRRSVPNGDASVAEPTDANDEQLPMIEEESVLEEPDDDSSAEDQEPRMGSDFLDGF